MLGIKWLNTGAESTYRADILQIHHISLDFWGFFIVPGRFERSLKKHEFSASDRTFCISTSFCIVYFKRKTEGILSVKLIINKIINKLLTKADPKVPAYQPPSTYNLSRRVPQQPPTTASGQRRSISASSFASCVGLPGRNCKQTEIDRKKIISKSA